MDENKRQIPTILLTGFLGAGKTTLLNRLIDHYRSQRTVLLINEFGQVGIDGELLVDGDYDKIELNKGSLFCICVRTDFIFEVERIARELKPDLLIIEATGLADTSEMEKMFGLPNLRDKILLKACICLVDVQNFLKITHILRAPTTQVQSADLVLINKIDLASAMQVAQVKEAVRKMAPNVPVITTRYADFPLTQLDAIQHPKLQATTEIGEGRPDLMISITLEKSGQFTSTSWNAFLAKIKPHLMRLKGFISLDQETWQVDVTLNSVKLTPSAKMPYFKNQLVFIGQPVKEQLIQDAFLMAITD